MNPNELLALIDASPTIDRFVEDHLLSRTPWIFGDAASQFLDWRKEVAHAAQVTDRSIYLVGSAATGYSLSPLKAGRPFKFLASGDRPSDIDLAVVSRDLFERAWERFSS